jgi:hypothetical protein
MRVHEFEAWSAPRMRLFALVAGGDPQPSLSVDVRAVCAGFVSEGRPQDGLLLEALLGRLRAGGAGFDSCCLALHAELARLASGVPAERRRSDHLLARLEHHVGESSATGKAARWKVLQHASRLLAEPTGADEGASVRVRWSEWARALDGESPAADVPAWAGLAPEALALVHVPEELRWPLARRLWADARRAQAPRPRARILQTLRRLWSSAHRPWTTSGVASVEGLERIEREDGDDG